MGDKEGYDSVESDDSDESDDSTQIRAQMEPSLMYPIDPSDPVREVQTVFFAPFHLHPRYQKTMIQDVSTEGLVPVNTTDPVGWRFSNSIM